MKKLALIIGIFYNFFLAAQSLTQWTEEDGTLGLGYPVPIPVDTPEPFDGFRTYAGLFSKHQSIALENPNVTGHIVGQTRNGQDIWAYVLSDENNLTKYGVKEGVMMINGGIHAREWQSPELLTGIIELLHENSEDQSLHQYLLENTMIITIPVNNVDGFLQTQRFPTLNWLGTDPGFPNTSPRDGRMRRKNMFQVDEDINTQNDHLLGIDLNRNNNPFWATTNSSSANPASIVYHGVAVDSEPETLARLAAANLASEDQFRVYTDAHSFSRLFFSVRTFNTLRNILQTRLLLDFSQHHVAYPAGKFYSNLENTPGSGIGVTSEYFAYTYQIPSWTLEIEPTINGGVEYGGLSRNGHDGFILPESEIKRVREQMAASSLIIWYGQAGPPSITQLRVIDKETETVVFDSEWDIEGENTRILYENSIENIIPEKDYSLLIRFDKPMRTRDMSNTIVNLQGQNINLNPVITASIGGENITLNLDNQQWPNEKNKKLKLTK
ncbi:MAG: hypothetical protein L3J52_06360 [Proteobacteria bacterium]|nr:hypothetical protein [Pseudomonadota bacterium]